MQPSFARLPLTLLSTAFILGVASLSACGNKDDKKATTQVAAKVGAEEISVHQINQILSHTNTAGATPQALQNMGREVLEKLIDQQLAVEQATENKLHRSPDVVSQLEVARRDILARAYLQQITNALPKPTDEEIKRYFSEHPQLFAERRIFNVQEIVLPTTDGAAEQLRSFCASGKSMDDMAAWLKQKDIAFNGGSATRAAEQIPMEILPRVYALKDGQSTVLESPQGITVIRMVSSQAAPVNQAAAQTRIAQFLANQRANDAVAANIQQLRANAKISYMGAFAKPDTSARGTDASPAAPTTNPTNSPPPTAIEKGIAGLK